jgi:hypothetical protein
LSKVEEDGEFSSSNKEAGKLCGVQDECENFEVVDTDEMFGLSTQQAIAVCHKYNHIMSCNNNDISKI